MTNYGYVLMLRKDVSLTQGFVKALGDHLLNQLDKNPQVHVKSLVIEKSNNVGQPHLHILLESDIPRTTLIETLDRIKTYTPVSLTTKGVISKVIPIFTAFKGSMPCEYFRDKANCPSKHKCNRLNEYGSLLCESNTNLEELKSKQHLNNYMKYLAHKKGVPNTLHHYYYEAD